LRTFHFHARLWVPGSRNDVFVFFSDALNLQEITPPWLQFRVTTPSPIAMRQGTEIDYRLKLRGVPMSWRSRISAWEPPERFVDEQDRGPYRMWVHEHRFLEDSGGTWCEDHVQYAVLGGLLTKTLFVESDIRKIFAYRSARLRAIFGDGQGAAVRME
jgi:ligand-binding SRPBCC domain-containing protein